jgi:hypothetical protein
LEPLPDKCGVPFVAERRIYAAATLQKLKMRTAAFNRHILDCLPTIY